MTDKRRTVKAMSFTVSTIAAATAAGAALSPIAARYAARRSTAQKLPYEGEAEQAVITTATDNPDTVELLHTAGLRALHFAGKGNKQAWADLAGGDPDPPDDNDPQVTEAIATLTADHPTLLAHAVAVVSSHDDRTIYRGAQKLEETGGEPPIRRVHQTPTLGRYLIAALTMSAGGAVIGIIAPPVAVAAILLAVVAYGYICAAVDYDTLYIDMRVFAIGSLSLWAAAVAVAATGTIPWTWVALGAGTVVIWGLVLEVTNRLYQAVRKRQGMGFGDTLIAVVTVGIPTAMTGSVLVGVYSVIFAAVIAAVVMGPVHLIKKRSRGQPFPFGPFLAVGWIPAWIVDTYSGFGGL